jgi:hypothetical protein
MGRHARPAPPQRGGFMKWAELVFLLVVFGLLYGADHYLRAVPAEQVCDAVAAKRIEPSDVQVGGKAVACAPPAAAERPAR